MRNNTGRRNPGQGSETGGGVETSPARAGAQKGPGDVPREFT